MRWAVKLSRVTPEKKVPASARIAEALRGAILSGELHPGDPIIELPLAARHHVSQTTVREALAKLEHGGFVRRIANKGTFVTSLSSSEFREHVRLRLVLESMAAVEAAQYMADQDFDDLDRRLKDLSAAVSTNDYFEAAQCDLAFHKFIWERSGDSTLCRILEQLTAPLFVFASLRRRNRREDLNRVVLAHEPIAEALKGRNPERIREAVRVHIENSYLRQPAAGVEALGFGEYR